MLAGNSSISLAGSEEHTFSQQSPTMLKMASESYIPALLLLLGLFLKISLWVPLILLRLWGFLCVRDAGRKGNKTTLTFCTI